MNPLTSSITAAPGHLSASVSIPYTGTRLTAEVSL